MSKWEALYMPGQDNGGDPSKAGFNSFEEAEEYVKTTLCKHCKEAVEMGFVVVELDDGEDTITITSALDTMCGAEWVITEYDN